MKRIYCDYAATTPVDERVLEAMLPCFREFYGNASSIHAFGVRAKRLLDTAREQVAQVIAAEAHEIVFTSGGTEANNMALQGFAHASQSAGEILVSAVEHPSVRQTCMHLQQQGWKITRLPADTEGRIAPETVQAAISPETRLISIMAVNNEVGTINPIAEIAALAAEKGIALHTDAVQAFGKIPIDVKTMPVTLLSLSGHKIYGPKGAGALYIRRGTRLDKILFGGRQEHDLRAGTENIPAIVGLGMAAELMSAHGQEEQKRLALLAEDLLEGLQKQAGAQLNGPVEGRLPQILNLSFPGKDSLSLAMALDLRGIAVSIGSACSSGTVQPSHVLKAMRVPDSLQKSALRFSLGRSTTKQDIRAVVAAVTEVVR